MEKEIKTYHFEQPSKVSKALTEAIIDTLTCDGVHPNEVYPVLAECIIRTLVSIAQTLGLDPVEYVHNFGKGIATCELKTKRKG